MTGPAHNSGMDDRVTEVLAGLHLSSSAGADDAAWHVAAEPRPGLPAPVRVRDTKTLRCPDRVVDRSAGLVTSGARPLSHLSPTELRLLNYLADRPGQVIDRDALWEAVWHQAPAIQSRAIDKTIRRLRTKIERDPANPSVIESVYGVGYRLNLGPGVTRDEAPMSPAEPSTGSSAPSDGGLVGREAELSALLAGLGQGLAHVLLVGAAGVGKSRLALAFVRALTAGHGLRCAARCDLAQATCARDVIVRVCEQLELEPCRDIEALAQRLAHLGPCSLLLDDVEGAAEAVRELMRAATAHAHDLMVVATSRFALGSRCARVVLLEPLSVEAAIELFLARARAASQPALRAWAAPGVRAQVATLVQRLDRLPLAIELAAARTAVLSPRELAQHLERRFDVLHDPLGRNAGRHASLRAALDGSWTLLAPLDREVLMACARFVGPFSAVAAREALATAPALHEGGTLLDTLHRLAAYSLVANLHDEAVEPQLVLHECVRDYALERLRALEA